MVVVVEDGTYASLVRWCGQRKALSHGRRLHAHMARHGRLSHCRTAYLPNLVLQMYGRCGSPQDSRSLFRRMVARADASSWNILVAAYAQNGLHLESLRLCRSMLSNGLAPNRFALLPLLSSPPPTTPPARVGSLALCHQISELIASAPSLHSDVLLHTALVTMYGRCGSVTDARSVFEAMVARDTVAWNAMIASYAQNGHGNDALDLFCQMLKEGETPNRVTFLCLLDACSTMGLLEEGRRIHRLIDASGFASDAALKNSLVNMYGECGSFADAFSVFDTIEPKSLISWSSMISAYARNGQSENALSLFRQMQLHGFRPNNVTFLCLLNVDNTNIVSLEYGRAIHESITAYGYDSDIIVSTSLLSFYGKCGSLKDAWSIFDGMDRRESISWNALLGVYNRYGHGKEALKLYQQMNLEGVKPDKVTFLCLLDACSSIPCLRKGQFIHGCIVSNGLGSDIALENALLNMYGKCGSLNGACSVFDRMDERNVVSWTSMLAAYACNGHCKEALKLLPQMELEGVKPNEVTFLSLLHACANLASLEDGQAIHEGIVASGFGSNIAVQTALLNFYGRCGNLKEAQSIFDGMPQKEVICWNAILSAYLHNGHCKEALNLFHAMISKGVKPDKVTFLCVLDACATLASLEHGRTIHECLVASGFESDLTIRNSLLNMYAKCGSLMESRFIFDETHKQDIVSWSAMLAAYAQNGHVVNTLELFRQMDSEGIKPNKVTFLSLLNACSHAGLCDEGWQYLTSMRDDYSMAPSQEHYMCMIDLLGRAGSLSEVEGLVKNMPVQNNVAAWKTLLGACRIYGDVD